MKTTIALLALVLATGAHAEQPLARDALQICDARMTGPNWECRYLILGTVDGVHAGMVLSKGKPWFCLPDAARGGEKFAVAMKYLHQHPEARSQELGEVIAAALAESYPCGHIKQR